MGLGSRSDRKADESGDEEGEGKKSLEERMPIESTPMMSMMRDVTEAAWSGTTVAGILFFREYWVF